MNLSAISASTVKTFLLGALGGALLVTYAGFSWGGWTLGSTAADMAEKMGRDSKVQALASVCADKFLQQANAGPQLESLKKLSSSDQKSLVEKGGFAASLGTKDDLSAVGGACATLLSTKDLP
jgi:hypothetical protein